jgi:hypothetical protein
MNPEDTVVSKIADAIAFAEGYNALGSRPRRNNNPGDLEQDVTGKAVGHDGPYVIYASPQDGLEGSHVYKPSMTIAEVARHYTSTDQEAWAMNVAELLGAGIETRLEDLA